MTSKEAIAKARARKGLPVNKECAIITDDELKVIENDLKKLEALRSIKIIFNVELYDNLLIARKGEVCLIENLKLKQSQELINLLKEELGK